MHDPEEQTPKGCGSFPRKQLVMSGSDVIVQIPLTEHSFDRIEHESCEGSAQLSAHFPD